MQRGVDGKWMVEGQVRQREQGGGAIAKGAGVGGGERRLVRWARFWDGDKVLRGSCGNVWVAAVLGRTGRLIKEAVHCWTRGADETGIRLVAVHVYKLMHGLFDLCDLQYYCMVHCILRCSKAWVCSMLDHCAVL